MFNWNDRVLCEQQHKDYISHSLQLDDLVLDTYEALGNVLLPQIHTTRSRVISRLISEMELSLTTHHRGSVSPLGELSYFAWTTCCSSFKTHPISMAVVVVREALGTPGPYSCGPSKFR
jgi:hypothetical protein